jgi:hypothetical protein
MKQIILTVFAFSLMSFVCLTDHKIYGVVTHEVIMCTVPVKPPTEPCTCFVSIKHDNVVKEYTVDRAAFDTLYVGDTIYYDSPVMKFIK